MAEESEQDFSLPRVFELLRTNSYIGRDSSRPRLKPKPTTPITTPTPAIISMEDIKPTRQNVPTKILKRPNSIVQSEFYVFFLCYKHAVYVY
jgi:hypothetical protein